MVKGNIEYHFLKVLVQDLFRESGFCIVVTQHRTERRIPRARRIVLAQYICSFAVIFFALKTWYEFIYALSDFCSLNSTRVFPSMLSTSLISLRFMSSSAKEAICGSVDPDKFYNW